MRLRDEEGGAAPRVGAGPGASEALEVGHDQGEQGRVERSQGQGEGPLLQPGLFFFLCVCVLSAFCALIVCVFVFVVCLFIFCIYGFKYLFIYFQLMF